MFAGSVMISIRLEGSLIYESYVLHSVFRKKEGLRQKSLESESASERSYNIGFVEREKP